MSKTGMPLEADQIEKIIVNVKTSFGEASENKEYQHQKEEKEENEQPQIQRGT